ncbi:MAG: hypothetical protein AB7S75_03605 [Desulfococcaceae bacterium]
MGQRKSAFELAGYARAGDNSAMQELIRMADGAWRKFLCPYTLTDQIAAIEALADTGREDALIYLKSLKVRKEIYKESCTGLACGSDHYPLWSAISCEFPNAKGELAENLRYTGKKFDISVSVSYLSEEDHPAIQKENPFHRIIDRCIERLEKFLVKNQSELDNNRKNDKI